MNLVAKVHTDDALSGRILHAVRERLQAEERSGIHVSDLVFPRKSWFTKHYPKPLLDEECLYFIAGRAHHEVVENLIASEEMREVKMEWNGIVGTVDCIEGDGYPVEFKTTRAVSPYTPETVPNHYILQLGMYVAMLNQGKNSGTGILVVLYLSQLERKFSGRRRSVPKLSAYPIHYADLDSLRGEMVLRKLMLEGPEAPPMNTCEPWLCRSCRYFENECEGHKEQEKE